MIECVESKTLPTTYASLFSLDIISHAVGLRLQIYKRIVYLLYVLLCGELHVVTWLVYSGVQ